VAAVLHRCRSYSWARLPHSTCQPMVTAAGDRTQATGSSAVWLVAHFGHNWQGWCCMGQAGHLHPPAGPRQLAV
jgi:hypothetical protein